MSGLPERISRITGHVEALLRQRDQLRSRVAELEAERAGHQRTVEVLKARVAQLEQEAEVLRRTKPATPAGEVPGTKQRIDELVNEIDRCLALLGE